MLAHIQDPKETMSQRSQRRRLRSQVMAMVVFVAGVVALVAGCGSDSGNGSSAPSVSPSEVKNASSEIQVLGWSYYEVPQQDAGNVTAKWSYPATGPDLITRARSGNFDVITNEKDAVPALDSLGIFVPIDTSLITNYDQIIPQLRKEFTSPDGDVIGIPFSVSPWFTAYDSSKVPEPRTLNDLLKPVYQDTITLQDDPLIVGQIAMEQGVKDTSEMTQEQLDRAMAFLDKLRPNVKTFFKVGEDAQLFNSGSVSVSMGSFGTIIGKAIENNPAIKIDFLGAGSFANAWSITRDDNVAADISWINQAMTVPAVEALVKSSADYPALPQALPAFKAADDPVSKELAAIPLPKLLKEAPVLQGYAPEATGDVVSINDVIRAWDEYKASF